MILCLLVFIEFGKKSLPIGGFLSGFFGGLSGNQGALRSSFLIKHGLDKETFIATTVVISTMVDFTRLGVYSSNILQINLEDYLTLGVSSILAAILGAFIGNKLLKKITFSRKSRLKRGNWAFAKEIAANSQCYVCEGS